MNGLRNCLGRIWDAIKGAIDKLKDWATNMINTAKEEVPKILDKIIEFFKELPDKLKEIGKNAIEGLVNGLKEKWNALKGTVGDFVNGIKDGFQQGLDIHSPSKVMRDLVGKNIVLGIEEGFLNALPNSVDTMQSALLGNMENLKYGNNGGNTLNIYTQELDSAKLDQIVDYVDKKFGVKFGIVY